jgi:hypothetical protein
MNKRIEELAEKAGIVNRKFSFDQYWEDDLTDEQKKFAKLIIKECLNICEDVAERNDPAIACYYDIKQRFGMKS